MGKSSIHILPVKSTSETHNLRLREYDYVRQDLTPENFTWGFENKLSEIRKSQENLYKEKVGQRMQKRATPIREGVFLVDKHTTDKTILDTVLGVEKEFGIKAIQLAVHRDEGHYHPESKRWKPNYHAHVVFDWQDKNTGKSFKLNREQLSELQTYFAKSLGMERGKASTRKHKSALEFKVDKLMEDFKLIGKGIDESHESVNINNEVLKRQFEMLNNLKSGIEKMREEEEKLINSLKDKTTYIEELAVQFPDRRSPIEERKKFALDKAAKRNEQRNKGIGY
tara:strand:- start:281 stop:1126 length:846 start_codon:yes stop_codon:yes gene_type:complete